MSWAESLLSFLGEAGGDIGGSVEILDLDLAGARFVAERILAAKGLNLDEELPDFNRNFVFVQGKVSGGVSQRKEMPVISTADIKALQLRLQQGHLDIAAPW